MAYIAGRAISGRKASAVYDYDAGGYTSFSGTVSEEKANVYDYGRSCNVSGRLSSLYDYGTSQHIQLKLKSGGRFDGYDYASTNHFSGKVSNRSVSIYDYETSRYYSFTV